MVCGALVVFLLIPIRRYKIALGLPFQLEPYRAVLFLLFGVWTLSLLGDPRERFRRSGLGAPTRLYFLAIGGGIVANPALVKETSGYVSKAVFVMLGFFLLLFFVSSVIRSIEAVDRALSVLVAGGALIAVLALIESRFGWSPFTDLDRYLPFLAPNDNETIARGANVRAMGPAEHPIALAALLIMILPLALYLALKRQSRVAWIGVILLAVGSTSGVSRTAVIMGATIVVCFLIVKPRDSVRFVPVLVPFLVLVNFATPGTLGTLKSSFFGETLSNQGRTEDYGPAFDEFARVPVFGRGLGTRITTGTPGDINADILDNQWLGSLLETGLVGVVALVWFLGLFVRRLASAARSDTSTDGWLLLALSSSVAAYAVGMFFFDSFSFIQVTLLLFFLLGLGSALIIGEHPILDRGPRSHAAAAPASAVAREDRRERRGRRVSAPGAKPI